MRPLPDLRQVRHHRRVRPTAASPAGGRAATHPRHLRERITTLHVYRLSEPIDDFDGLTPLNEWLDGDAERLAWALRAVLAMAQAASTVGWRGDMRHLPLIGHLPTSPFVTRYLVAKQDNNGDTF